jgi:hypothetical protein
LLRVLVDDGLKPAKKNETSILSDAKPTKNLEQPHTETSNIQITTSTTLPDNSFRKRSSKRDSNDGDEEENYNTIKI